MMTADPNLDSSGPVTATSDRSPSYPDRSAGRGSRWRLVRGVLIVLGVAGLVVVAGWLSWPGETELAGNHALTHTVQRADLRVKVVEEGALESASNTEIKCLVKGGSTILWIVDDGTTVQPGDELIRFDSSALEEEISQQEIAYENARSTFVQSESDLAVAQINVTEYLEGIFRKEQKTAAMNVSLAKANLLTAENQLEHAQRMFRKGYVSQRDADTAATALQQAQLDLEVKETELEVLERFTKIKKVEELNSALRAAEAKLASDQAALKLEKARLDRKRQQLEHCVVVADTEGMVLYAAAREWEQAPAIDVGTQVVEQQTLLRIPDLSQMQVKIRVHESKVDQVEPGMRAIVTLQDEPIEGEVKTISPVTAPAGWWNGNQVAYDTLIDLPSQEGLKPGMSADVEVILAEYSDVLTVPVAAVVEQTGKFFCWVQQGDRVEKRALQIGASDDQFIVVEAGVSEGEQVLLNPLDVEDAPPRVEDGEVEVARARSESHFGGVLGLLFAP